MATLTRGFFKGKMNKDVDDRLLPDGEYRDALNVEVGTSSGSNLGLAQNILGNTLSSDLEDLVDGADITNARCIGAISVPQEKKIYWIITSDSTDGIYEYDIATSTATRVCQSDKNGNNALNFSVDNLITGFNYIKLRDDSEYLYFTDALNPPRKVNIGRVKTYDIDDENLFIDINVIVRPPLYAPAIVPSIAEVDDEQNNLLEKFVQVAYRWKYIDGEWSSLSPFTPDIFQPNGTDPDYFTGSVPDMTNKFNSFEVFFNTGNELVTDIQIVYTDSRAQNLYVIDTLNKTNNAWAENTTQSIIFKHNKIYSVLPAIQLERLFDNVPLLAKAQEISGSRLMYGNYTQFFDVTEELLDFTVEVKSQALTNEEYLPTLKSGRNYEVALLYTDDFGRMTTALAKYDANTFIKYSDSDKANSLEVTINHIAPDFATNFRLAIKQDKEDYYNIFPRGYYLDDAYRWFLINDSDVDKAEVGKYIVLKASNNIIRDGEKYKILEKVYQPSNFLGSGQPQGLYFRIKATANEFNGDDIFNYIYSYSGNSGVAWKPTGTEPSKLPYRNMPTPTPVEVFFYGTGDTLDLVMYDYSVINQTSNNSILNGTLYGDKRIIVEIFDDGQLKFRYKNVLAQALNAGAYSTAFGTSFLVSDYTELTTPKQIKEITETTNLGIQIQFSSTGAYNPGDYWVIRVKTTYPTWYSFANAPLALGEDQGVNYWNPVNWAGGYRPAVGVLPTFGEVLQGNSIRIKINQTQVNSTDWQQFEVGNTYYDFEEWFYESGAYQNFILYDDDGNQGYKRVFFRRASVTSETAIGDSNANIAMFLVGYEGTTDTLDNTRNFIDVDYTYYSLTSQIVFETDPLDTDVDIYHELSHTYAVDNDGKHIVGWKYDDWEFAGGLTRLTQLGDNRNPHYFNVGDSIYVRHSNTSRIPEGYYDVTNVEDRYSVIIDFAFPGSGAAEVGYIYFNEDDINQVGLNPAVITLNHKNVNNNVFNAFTFGNGIESNRIRDDYNEATTKLSRRVTTTIEDYRQENRRHSICYSQPFSVETEDNRFNEFILATVNYKNLDIEFGSIQKLFARDTDLVVFQENKISSVLVNKNLISSSDGGGEIVASSIVLGTQLPNLGDFGISSNPESFASWGESMWCIDKRRGAIIQVQGRQSFDISELDMKDYFRDMLNNETDPIVALIGGYDVHTHQYIVAKKTDSDQPEIIE